MSVDAHGNPVLGEGGVSYAEEAGAEAGEENIRLSSEADGLGEVICKAWDEPKELTFCIQRRSRSGELFSAGDEIGRGGGGRSGLEEAGGG